MEEKMKQFLAVALGLFTSIAHGEQLQVRYIKILTTASSIYNLDSWNSEDKHSLNLLKDTFDLVIEGKARIATDTFIDLNENGMMYAVDDMTKPAGFLNEQKGQYLFDETKFQKGLCYYLKRITGADGTILELSEKYYTMHGREVLSNHPEIRLGKPTITTNTGIVGSVYVDKNKEYYFLNLTSIDNISEISFVQILKEDQNFSKHTIISGEN